MVNDELKNDYTSRTKSTNRIDAKNLRRETLSGSFYVPDDIKYKINEFQNKIECLIIQPNIDSETIKNFALSTDHTVKKTPWFFARVRKPTRGFTASEK